MGRSPGSVSICPGVRAAASIGRSLDDDHASAAAVARRAEVVRFFHGVLIERCGDVQEFASKREAGLATGAGKQPVVSDAR